MLGTIVGGLIGMGQTAFNNWMSQEAAAEARAENYRYNEMAAVNANKRARQNYMEFYSPEALMKQYKEAGLSPSLMFGGTPGQGGMTAPAGAGASGPQAQVMPYDFLSAAQAEALMAQAKKTEAETDVIEGKNQRGQAEIAGILAEAGYKDASKAVQEAQKQSLDLSNYLSEHTMQANIYTICELADKAAYESAKAYNEMRSSKVLADLDEKTFETKCEYAKEELKLLVQNVSVAHSQWRLNDQQTRSLYNDTLAMWEKISQGWKDLEIQQQQATTYTDWINAQIPTIQKQLEIRLKELGLEKSRLIVDAITDTLKSLAMGAVAASSMGIGKGSNQTPPIEKMGKPVGKSKTTPGVPVYKNNTIWSY